MAVFANEVSESECSACVDEIWVKEGEQPPFSWCRMHLMRATFLLEQSGVTEPSFRNAGDGRET